MQVRFLQANSGYENPHLPSAKVTQVRVSAVNAAGESQPSALVEIAVP